MVFFEDGCFGWRVDDSWESIEKKGFRVFVVVWWSIFWFDQNGFVERENLMIRVDYFRKDYECGVFF